MVDADKVVVHGFRHADESIRRAHRPRPSIQERHGVHRPVSADVEKRLNIVLLENAEQEIDRFVVVMLEFPPARTDDRARRLLHDVQIACALAADVGDIAGQHALDAAQAPST